MRKSLFEREWTKKATCKKENWKENFSKETRHETYTHNRIDMKICMKTEYVCKLNRVIERKMWYWVNEKEKNEIKLSF